MWERIVQGLAWDTMKVLVRKAIETLKHKGVAPASEDQKVTQKEATELGFAWTNYLNGKKQYHLFLGLKKVYVRETKRKPEVSRERKSNFSK